MSERILKQTICLTQHLSEKEYTEINQLKELCSLQDKTNLKLELDYKLNMNRSSEIGLKSINEFLYYVEDILVGYLGLSSFGGSNIGEINGMTHPDFRRKGLFRKLLELAIDECRKRSFIKVLLLTDGNSSSGVEFIKAVHCDYDFSEYRMKRLNKTTLESNNSITLRKAGKLDRTAIGKQNAVYFDHAEESEAFPEQEEALNKITYMVELKQEVIGKITVKYRDHAAFISGFGIMPEFRSKGYGKATLSEALRIINEMHIEETELDVECKNNTALNLYKTCGFEEKSVMNYYKYNI